MQLELLGEIPEHVLPTAIVIGAFLALIFLGAGIELSVGLWRRIREGPSSDRPRRPERRRRRRARSLPSPRAPLPVSPSRDLESEVRDRLYGPERGRGS